MAAEYYKIAAEINPTDSWAWFGAGDSFLYLGDIASAKSFYKKALDLDPNNSYQLKRMGDLLVRLGEINEALNVFKRVSLLEKKSITWLNTNHGMYEPKTYIEKGDFYYRQSDLEGALKAYKLAEGLGSKEAFVKIVSITEKIGLVDADGERLRPLKDSENAMLLNSKARHLMSTGDYEKAEALIDSVLSFDRAGCITLQNKIDLMQRQKKPFEEIRPYMERLLSLNNKDVKGFISGKDAMLVFDLEKNGLMSSSGVKEINFILPIGLLGVEILASGTLAKDEWPHMLVRMNSAPILSKYVSSASYVEFVTRGFSQEGVNFIKIEFSNDYFDSLTGEDRNLKIGKIILTYKSPDYEN
jgi:tetratricopeptide (TPR) repeat protein